MTLLLRPAGKDITGVITREEVGCLGGRCIGLGAKVVMIKCGAPGLYYRTSDGKNMEALCERLGLSPEEWRGKEGFEESYVPEAVLSGTGAGDTSIAAFLVSVLNGESLQTAVSMAAAIGASCVAAYDALSGLKSTEELKAKIKNGWKKQKLNKRL